MTPETERRFLTLVVARGVVAPDAARKLAAEPRLRDRDGRRATLARRLVEQGFVDRATAVEIIRLARAERAGSPATTTTLREAQPRAGVLARPAAAAARQPTPGALAPGSELGPYRIVAELGRGGMGVVYRAFDRRLGREVALKTILGLADVETTERFVREARAAARLRHPGVVQVHDAGIHAGICFAALELVEGGSLAARLADGPLPPNAAAEIVRDLALAVAAAHAEGIIHRDLKPANVLLDRDGRARLTDFGLARDLRGADLTETGAVLGTPAYMAPEQANGDKAAIGPRTDVYGIGAVLYHTLAGSAPFQGNGGLAVMHKVLTEEVESPSRRRLARGLAPLAVDLETIVAKALEKAPDARYSSAELLAADLTRFLVGEPILGRPLARRVRFGRWLRRNRAVVAVGALGLAGIVSVASVASVARSREQRLRREQEQTRIEDLRRAADATSKRALEAIEGCSAQPLEDPDWMRLGNAEGACQEALEAVRAYAREVNDDAGRAALREVAMRILGQAERIGSRRLMEAAARDLAGTEGIASRLERLNRRIAIQDKATGLAGNASDNVNESPVASLSLLEEALRLDPTNLHALWAKRDILTRQERWDDVVSVLRRMIEADPMNADRWHDQLAIHLLSLQRYGEAENEATKVLESSRSATHRSSALCTLATVHAARDDLARALEEIVRACDERPTVMKFRAQRGGILAALGRTEEARVRLEAVVADAPDYNMGHFLLGRVDMSLGRRDEGCMHLAAALRLKPDSPEGAESRRLLAELGASKPPASPVPETPPAPRRERE